MGSQLIISVGREFGSGGHVIAEALAKHYDIQFIDHHLMEEVALERNLNYEELKEYDEKEKKPIITRRIRGLSNSPEENLAYLQFDYLKKKATKGDSFVIVGRCSEHVLREFKTMVSIFVLGDRKCKAERVMERYSLKESAAIKLMDEKDFKRKRYHNSHCEGKWGDSRNYDISVNSSKLGIDDTVKMLIDYIDMRRGKMD